MDSFQLTALVVAALGGYLFVAAFLSPSGTPEGTPRTSSAMTIRIVLGVIMLVGGLVSYLMMRDISHNLWH